MSYSNLFSAKELYSAPCCEILSVQAEGVLCLSPGEYGDAGAAGSTGSVISQGGGEDY